MATSKAMSETTTGSEENSDRLVAPTHREEDELETSLRPKRLSEFVGQAQARANISVFIEAAKSRGEPLDHVLFSGPPGLGKTTLAQIVSRELGVGFRSTSGPVLARAGDLAALLTNLEPRDVSLSCICGYLALPICMRSSGFDTDFHCYCLQSSKTIRFQLRACSLGFRQELKRFD